MMAPNKEFGDNAGKSVIESGHLTSADALYSAYLAQCMWELQLKSSDAEPDPWKKPEFRTDIKSEC